MELYFLGTSSGVPTKSRNVSAIALLESKGKGWFLIDCGERLSTNCYTLRYHLIIYELFVLPIFMATIVMVYRAYSPVQA